MILSREAILKAEDLSFEIVDVPEWGGEVKVTTLTGTERDAFESSLIDQKRGGNKVNTTNIRAKLVSMACVDDDGKRIFTPADIEILGSKSASALDRIFTVAQRLSKLTEADVEELSGN